MRQKLLPIFLAEAGRNLKTLKRYLLHGDVLIGDPEELEDAFRAAHTIKGTAQLVEAQAIHRIARRLEALLEKHVTAATAPTPVECEAMQLAIDWLYQLLDALKEGQPESKTLVEEALQALDLAERFPGSTRLVELLKSADEQRAPQLIDPFADDASLLPEAETSLESKDPFSDDPDFGLELDAVTGTFGSRSDADDLDAADSLKAEIDDPFAEDAPLETLPDQPPAGGLPDLFGEDPDPDPVPLPDALPENVFDPFAGDPTLLEGDGDLSLTSEESRFAAEGLASNSAEDEMAESAEIDGTQAFEDVPSAENLPPKAAVDDPFAEDPTLEAMIEDRALPASAAPAKGESAQTESADSGALPGADPQELIMSMQLGRDEEQPRRDYLACAFRLCGRDYYLPIEQMREIAELPPVLPVPLAPPLVSGLINLRGQVMPVIDLSVLHPGEGLSGAERRLVVGEYRGELAAFLAEGIPYLSEKISGEKIDMAVFLAEHRISGVEK